MIKNIKKLSWLICVLFIISIISLQADFILRYNFLRAIIEQLTVSLPLLIFVVFLSQHYLIDSEQTLKGMGFQEEFISILLCFFIGTLINFIIDHNNSDLKAWWPLALYFIFFYGAVFSLIYSIISLLFSLPNKLYHYIFSGIILTTISMISFLPRYVSIFKSKDIDILFVLLIVLLLLHLILLCGFKIIRWIRI